MTSTEMTRPLEAGVRVSLELPEAGTCVAVVASTGETSLVLDLLDDILEGELEPGSTFDLFMPRSEGIYHWLCSLSSAPEGQRAEVELLNSAMFVQRRLERRVEAEVRAQVRRIHSSRRGRPCELVVADLSHGGLKLEGPQQLSTGDTLEITMDVDTPVQVMGRAVMAYPTPAGSWVAHVSFLEGQREVIDVVDAYVARQLRERSS
jgi:PilZ domain